MMGLTFKFGHLCYYFALNFCDLNCECVYLYFYYRTPTVQLSCLGNRFVSHVCNCYRSMCCDTCDYRCTCCDTCDYRCAYLAILKICKLLLTAVGHGNVQVVVDAFHRENQSLAPQVGVPTTCSGTTAPTNLTR